MIIYGIFSVANLTAPSGKGEYTAELNRYTDNTYTEIDTRSQYKTTDTLYVMVSYYLIIN